MTETVMYNNSYIKEKKMEFYKRLIIKILERTTVGENNHLLVKLKSGHDLTQKERAELEELFDSIL